LQSAPKIFYRFPSELDFMSKHQRVLVFVGLFCLLTLLVLLLVIGPKAFNSPFEEKLQAGDLRVWRELFATPPANSESIIAMRNSLLYWLLSPMAWFWLLLIWAYFACWHQGWRLSTYGRLGFLTLILALPIGWLFYWPKIASSIVLMIFYFRYSFFIRERERHEWKMIVIVVSISLVIVVIIQTIGLEAVSVFGTVIGAAWMATFGLLMGLLNNKRFVALIGMLIGLTVGAKYGYNLGSLIVVKFGTMFGTTFVAGTVAGLAIMLLKVLEMVYIAGRLGRSPQTETKQALNNSIEALIISAVDAGFGVGLGVSVIMIYFQRNFWNHYFLSVSFDSLLLITTVLLVWLILSLMSVFLSTRFLPWLKACKQTTHWLCKMDYHRFRLGPGLPKPVRWSGRLLMVEEPRLHENFVYYFVCRYCGQKEFMTVRRLIGVIGALPMDATPDELNISLFDPDSRKAISADIDRLAIYPPPTGQSLDYNYAVNKVLDALSDDHQRRRHLRKIPVYIHGSLTLPENTRRMLARRFGRIQD